MLTPDETRLLSAIQTELDHGDRALFDSLSDHEKSIVATMLAEARLGNNDTLSALWEVDYNTKPVDVLTFLSDSNYLGLKIGNSEGEGCLFEEWAKVLDELFKNQAWEFILTGSIGTGKCVRKDALLFTNKGVIEAESVYNDTSVTHVMSESGMRNITHKHDEGVTATKRITTKHGHTISVRPNHRLRVLAGLSRQWKEAQHIAPGDVLLEQPAATWGTNTLNPAYAELVGWTIAEGDFSRGKQLHLCISSSEVDYLRGLVAQAGLTVYAVNRDNRNKAATVVYYDDKIRSFYSNDTRSATVAIPEFVLSCDAPTICSVIRGLFSGDGSIDARDGIIEYCSMSEVLITQLRVLLTNLGIECSVTSGDASYTNEGEHVFTGIRYRLRICGYNAKLKFRDLVGFSSGNKADRLDAVINKGANRNSDNTFSIRLSREDALALRSMQPVGSGEKTKTPKGLIQRLVGSGGRQGQRCTVSLLRSIVEAGGVLTDDLAAIAEERLLFDEVESVTDSVDHCYDFTVEGDPSYIANGFINHNTSIAVYALIYKLYRLSCLRDPQRFYGLLPGHPIVFGLYNVFKYKAKSTSHSYMRAAIERSPYFANVFKRNKKKTTEIEFDKNIKIVYGSNELHALGENVFGVLIDETDFMKKGADEDERGQAWTLYNSTLRRIESRFMRGGDIPGLMVLVSSKTQVGSFIEKRSKDRSAIATTVVADKCLWDVKPWRYSGATFPVFTGDSYSSPRILTEEEAAKITPVARIPVEHRMAFDEDLEGALRDIAGISTASDTPLIPSRELVHACTDKTRKHPFTREEFTVAVDDDDAIEDYFDYRSVLNINRSQFTPKVRPGAKRYIHIDLALSGDSVGFAMGHTSGLVEVARSAKSNEALGSVNIVMLPSLYMDMMLRIVPRKGTQIDLSKIRQFVLALRSWGYPIELVTFDSFESSDSVQQLIKQGIKSEILSVDRADGKDSHPYAYFKQAVTEGRLNVYHYPRFIVETVNLQKETLFTPSGTKWKIDHPKDMLDLDGNKIKGSKDVVDACCGVVRHLMVLDSNHDVVPDKTVKTVQRPSKPSLRFMGTEDWVASDYTDLRRIKRHGR